MNIKNNPKISVILTSYNHAKYIGEAIDGVLSQSFKDFELIIIDDKSSDNSVEIIQKYQDPRINFIKNEINLGMCAAINLGILQAKGKYIAHICSDDIWFRNDKLQKQFDFLEEEKNSNYGAVFTLPNPINEDGSELKDRTNPHCRVFYRATNRSREEWLRFFFYDFNCLCFPTALVRKTCYEMLGGYDSRYSMMLDLDMWIRIALKYNIFVIQEKMISFRVGEASTSSQDNARVIANFESGKLLNHFLKIDDADLLYKILDIKKDSDLTGLEFCNFLLLRQSSESKSDVHQRFFIDVFFDKMSDKKFMEILTLLGINQVLFHQKRNVFLKKFIRKNEPVCSKEGCGLTIREVPHFRELFLKRSFLEKVLNPLREIKKHLVGKEVRRYENR